MALTKNEKYLVVGTTDGILYIWNVEEEEEFLTLEVHKDKGEITNIVPISKPLCMFGLNCKLQDTVKLPFLVKGDKSVGLGTLFHTESNITLLV